MMDNNTLTDIMLICKGWVKNGYGSTLDAIKAYYAKYYTVDNNVTFKFDERFANEIFLIPLVKEAIHRDEHLLMHLFIKTNQEIFSEEEMSFDKVLYFRLLSTIAMIRNETFSLDAYQSMFDEWDNDYKLGMDEHEQYII